MYRGVTTRNSRRVADAARELSFGSDKTARTSARRLTRTRLTLSPRSAPATVRAGDRTPRLLPHTYLAHGTPPSAYCLTIGACTIRLLSLLLLPLLPFVYRLVYF